MNPKALIISVRDLLVGSIILLASAACGNAQGTLPIALQQQFSFSGCSTTSAACGTPLIGGLLYFYQVGTVATPQNSYQDTALTILNPFPLQLDANGRVPPFYLANGSVHVRLTDASGVVQFDYPSMLVIGPSSGGGGGGGSVDPTAISSTGDIKFRATGESLTGWVKANGLTVGSAVSGATGRANADTQSLFVYLWINCANPTANRHCPVVGGLGANAIADFNANKQITLFDWRATSPVGLDDMGNAAVGRLLASNVTSGGGDGVTTPAATGGEANHTLISTEMPAHTHAITDPGHAHSVTIALTIPPAQQFAAQAGPAAATNGTTTLSTTNVMTGITGTQSTGGDGAHNNMPPFILGTWYLKL